MSTAVGGTICRSATSPNSYVHWKVPHDPADSRRPGHMPWGNSVRIQLDARCELIDQATGKSDEFFLITPCRSEWMYRDDTLFQVPNREYVSAWSRTEALGLSGVQPRVGGGGSRVVNLTESFTEFSLTVKHFGRPRLLGDDREIVQETLDDLLLVGMTELVDERSGIRAVMEYPIKTMNVHPERVRFQVDTGPLLFPDLSGAASLSIEQMRMAFVCYNSFDVADFVLRETSGGTVTLGEDYTEVRRVVARSSLFCADPA